MEIKQTWWGKIVTIPETEFNSEFSYHLRNVRRINDNEPEEQELINELEPKEQDAEQKLITLAEEMEAFFHSMTRDKDGYTGHNFDKWKKEHNGANFNEYFHDRLRDLESEVNSYSFEYAERSQHGWCL